MEDNDPDDKIISYYQKEFKLKDDFLIFQIDLKKEQYQNNFIKINSIFQGEFTKFIRNIKDENYKEIYILLRKYQYFFKSFCLNSSDIIPNRKEENFNVKGNNIIFMTLDLLPKFKKNEINFEISNDLLNLEIKMNIEYISSLGGLILKLTNFDIDISNLKQEKIYLTLKNTLNKEFVLYYESIPNIFRALNKYLTNLENYLPILIKKSLNEQPQKNENKTINNNEKESVLNWIQEEQDKFEEAMIKYKAEKDLDVRFTLISKYVGTKTSKACRERYKILSKVAKSKKNEKSLNLIDDIKDKKKENVNLDSKISKLSSNFQEKELDQKEIKLILPDKEQFEFKKEIIPLKVLKNLEDDDNLSLVDKIMLEFQNTYLINVNSTERDYQEEEKQAYNKKIIDQVDSEQENQIKNGMEEDFYDFEGNLNVNLSSQNKNHLNQIISLIKTGDRNGLKVYDILMVNSSLAKFTNINLYAKCGKCKQITFETKFIRLNKNFDIFYAGCVCPKCKNEIQMIFKADYLHLNNTSDGGIIFSKGVQILDYLPSNILIYCLNCDESIFKIKDFKGGMRKSEYCHSCQKKIEICFQSVKFDIIQFNDYTFLENFTVENFQKFTFTIEINDNCNFIPKYEKVGNPGNPLTNNGTCKHYKNSCRWFRFPCCGI